ncbi:MAG: RNA polymerase sigma factor RpoD/SigA [Lentisphaeria bacterium]|nr:RNA polymerase sigma factor RpoD/SigA [Lentisphaeria bacterium]
MISDNDTLKLYMQNIMQYPRISTAQEGRLAKRIAQGDMSARSELINSNLRLVVKIAHDFKGRGLPLLDLISEGNIGLMRAVEKFDPSKGAKLSSYAAWWIKQAMRHALSNQASIIRVPTQSALKMVRIQAARTRLTQELGRAPTAKEIAAASNLTERTVNGLRVGRSTTVSLQAPLQPGMEGELTDVIADETTVAPDTLLDDNEIMNLLQKLLDTLDAREHQILDLRFGLTNGVPCTLERVSAMLKLTRERVRQIQNQALLALRAMINEDVPLSGISHGNGPGRRVAELLEKMASRVSADYNGNENEENLADTTEGEEK